MAINQSVYASPSPRASVARVVVTHCPSHGDKSIGIRACPIERSIASSSTARQRATARTTATGGSSTRSMGSSARARSRWTRRWAVTRAFAVVAFAAASEGGVSGAPFANGGALRAAVQNCLAVDPTGGCDCANATVDCGAAGSDPMELWDVSAVTDISFMFSGATSFNQPIGNWNVSAVTDMSGLFSGATSFNQPIGNWNVSAVTSMNNMFEDARSFNQPIGNWNVSAVTDISFMFANARSFNQPIGNWNVSAVTGMYSMFRGATSFNQPIGSWNVSAVTNMAYIFANASSFDQPIGAWNTASVRIMDDMFTLAKSFDQPIGGWNTRNVVTMRRMFSYASKFNQDISTWNVSNVRSTRAMFALASRFDQDITVWDSPLLLSNETFAMFHCANAWLATHKRSDGSLHTTGPPSAWTMSAGAWTGSTCGDVQSDASNDINVTFHVSGPFTTEDASAGDRVGQRMSTSGNVTLVGYARDDVTSTSRGAAYIFERNVAGWTQTHKLTPSNASQFEDFGVYVKLSGETAFIWSTPNLSYAPRCIHVFRRIGSTWTETQILTVPADLELEAERFELTTTHAFVRARAYSDPRRRQRMIIVYKVLSNGTWVYDTRIPLEVTNFWSEGSFIRVPPPGYYYIQKAENDRLFMTMSHMRGGVEGRGFVFKYSGSSWILEAELPLIGLYSWCPSGAFTGSIVLIGCNALRYNIGVDSEARGVVYVYERNESNWYLTASIEPPDATQYFGGTIDISGEYALIGDPRSRPYGDSQGNRGADAGVVYVFQRINAFTWVEKTRIYANDAAPSDLFGDSQPNYAFTGSRAMVGAGGHGANGQDSGAFYEVNFEFKPVAAASEGGVSGAPFANGGALRTAVQNCLAVDPTGGCDCANATVDCGAAGSDPMELWDVSAVDDMYQLFRGAQSFNQPIGNWNVSAVTDISFMFANARSFNQPIGNW
ncbi:Bacterial surface protein 26-residue repeat, partial [Ostreococcus tauri]